MADLATHGKSRFLKYYGDDFASAVGHTDKKKCIMFEINLYYLHGQCVCLFTADVFFLIKPALARSVYFPLIIYYV